MKIKFYDDYNGMETYFYNFNVSLDGVLIDFETFGSIVSGSFNEILSIGN